MQVFWELNAAVERWWDAEPMDLGLCADLTHHAGPRFISRGNVHYAVRHAAVGRDNTLPYSMVTANTIGRSILSS